MVSGQFGVTVVSEVWLRSNTLLRRSTYSIQYLPPELVALANMWIVISGILEQAVLVSLIISQKLQIFRYLYVMLITYWFKTILFPWCYNMSSLIFVIYFFMCRIFSVFIACVCLLRVNNHITRNMYISRCMTRDLFIIIFKFILINLLEHVEVRIKKNMKGCIRPDHC